mmetsp:Transcript_19137/g.36297  ORF Transcript_19137/g.36297 Transcript_19137/m.36297 type:complete len:552 (+) Transcript_19137:2-1657(+)
MRSISLPSSLAIALALTGAATGFIPSSIRLQPPASSSSSSLSSSPNPTTSQIPQNPNPTPSTPQVQVPYGMRQISSIIAISSCKGGVGKSTTAVNLAFSLRALNHTVGIFDADVYGPSLPTMVTPESDAVRFIGRQIAPLERDGVRLMSFGYVNEGSAVMRGPMVTQLLDQFLSLTQWGDLDYLILDMPPGTGDIQLTLTQKLDIDAAVIVTTPQELSFVDVERGVEMFDTVEVPCVAVVENMAYLERESEDDSGESDGDGTNAGAVLGLDEEQLKLKFVEALKQDGLLKDDDKVTDVASDLVKLVQANLEQQQQQQQQTTAAKASGKQPKQKEQIRIFGPGHKRRLSEQWGIEHSYSVPLLGKIAQNGDSGTPFVVSHPDSPQADIYRQLAKSVVEEVAKIKEAKAQGGGRPVVKYDSGKHVLEIFDPKFVVSSLSEEKEEADTEAGTSENATQESKTMAPADLRRACRCAACVEEMTGKQLLDPASIPDSVMPLTMNPTGNYALSVDWSDGHRSLYPYRQIRSLLEAKREGNEESSSKDEASVKEEVSV